MSERPTVVLLGATRERHASVTAALEPIAFLSKEVNSLALSKSRIVLVDLTYDLERGLRAVEEVRRVIAQVQIVAVADAKDPEVILRAMRAGACEFVVLADGRELAAVVKLLLQRGARESRTGTILSVFPSKGGVGATTAAVNLACALSRLEARVLLVDFERQLGAVLAFLDLAPRESIGDVAKNLHRLDRELLLSSLAHHASGPYVVAQPDSLEDGDAVTAAQATEVLQFAARHFDYVICDGLRGFDELSVAVLDASSRVELVLTQDVIALKNAKRCLSVFQRLGYDKDKVEILINRYQSKAPIDVAAASDNLGLEVRCTVANDYPAAVAALNRGLPIESVAPRSPAVRDLGELARRLTGTPPEKPRNLFRMIVSTLATKESPAHVARRTPEAT
ncbi:AAA family ATPase [Pendulispora brunnea]|uniref:AAA family ATPase n=1 Tax=Pendulispora brunnea TaxID=2905690 RepID=A0ABZ2K1X5_9BACT